MAATLQWFQIANDDKRFNLAKTANCETMHFERSKPHSWRCNPISGYIKK